VRGRVGAFPSDTGRTQRRIWSGGPDDQGPRARIRGWLGLAPVGGLDAWEYSDPTHGAFRLTVDADGLVVEYEGFA